MKLRLGFVSNSSSSSYIVYIPKNHKINQIIYDKVLKQYKLDEDKDGYTIKEFMEEYEKLLKDKNLLLEDTRFGGSIQRYLEKSGFIVMEVDVESSGSKIILFDDDCVSKFKQLQLQDK